MVFVVLLSILWLFLAKKLKQQYVISLNGFLKNRHILSDNLIPLNDIDLNFFLNLLKSPKEIEVIYAIETISKMNYEKIDAILKEQINHESKKVRVVVLDCIDKMELYSFLPLIEKALKDEKDIDVLTKLIEIYCKFLKTQSVEMIKNYLFSENITIQDSTIISMIKYAGIDGILIAGKILNDILNDQTKESQIRGLNIVNKINMHGFYSAILNALKSDNFEIRKISLEIVGNLKIINMIDYLIENLTNYQYRKTCINALIKFDISIYDTLVAHFKNCSMEKKTAIIKVFANIKSEKTATFILNQIDNKLLFDKILKSLFSANFHTDNKELILKLLIQNAKDIVVLIQLEDVIDSTFSNSKIVLHELLHEKMENIFYILSFIYPKDVINKLLFSYRNFLNDKKAYIVEIIDNLADNHFKPFVINFIENNLDNKRVFELAHKFDVVIDDYKFYIKDMLQKREFLDILAISFLYEIGKSEDIYFLDIAKELSCDENLLLKETASWAYLKLKEKNNAFNS